MPLIRNIVKVGNSRAVVLPSDWLHFYEEKAGHPLETILMEITGDSIVLTAPSNGKEAEEKPEK